MWFFFIPTEFINYFSIYSTLIKKKKEQKILTSISGSQLTLQQAFSEKVYERLYENKWDSKTQYPIYEFISVLQISHTGQKQNNKNKQIQVFLSTLLCWYDGW